jgi:hypothetical protein
VAPSDCVVIGAQGSRIRATSVKLAEFAAAGAAEFLNDLLKSILYSREDQRGPGLDLQR